MKIAIHHRENSFSKWWLNYCVKNNIDHKVVNCYDNDIVQQLEDCDALMWQHHHISPRDIKFAKQLCFSLEMGGKAVFPNFRSSWHFDDKLGQKYLFESIKAPMVTSYAFYSKKEAKKWVDETIFPKVFKLRGGASGDNVRLVRSKKEALRIVRQAFGPGFGQYNAVKNLKERWRMYRGGLTTWNDVLRGIVRLAVPTPFSRMAGKERGYVYFQDFIPDNDHDIRVNFVYGRCFAFRRKVRSGDFRASGSGVVDFDMSNIPQKALSIAFEVADKLQLQSAAFDFVIHNHEPIIVEVSYGFGPSEEKLEHGYWDADLNYYPGKFDPFGWMVEGMIKSINTNTTIDERE